MHMLNTFVLCNVTEDVTGSSVKISVDLVEATKRSVAAASSNTDHETEQYLIAICVPGVQLCLIYDMRRCFPNYRIR